MVLPFAQNMLREHGEFYPFGSAMHADGRTVFVAGYDGHEHPKSVDLIALLEDAFREAAKRGEYKATALAYDVSISLPGTNDKSDGITVSLNHKDGFSGIVTFPYELSGSEVSIYEPFAEPGKGDIFPTSGRSR